MLLCNIQNEYKDQVEDVVNFLVSEFNPHVLAIYIGGSVWNNEAIPYVSDVDINMIMEYNIDSKNKIDAFLKELRSRYCFSAEIHINVYSIDFLAKNPMMRFIIIHNSGLLYGINIVKQINDKSSDSVVPSVDAYMKRRDFAIKCFKDLVDERVKLDNIGLLPADEQYASRKIVQYFLVIEGAYYLMKMGRFISFETALILEQLRSFNIISASEAKLCLKIIRKPKSTEITIAESIELVKEKAKVFLFD